MQLSRLVAVALCAMTAAAATPSGGEPIESQVSDGGPPLASVVTHRDARAAADPTIVKEDPDFDPYAEEGAPLAAKGTAASAKYIPKQRKVEVFDFDPSEGLTFHVFGGKKECFYQDAKYTGDEISGAYVVASADSHIDLEIKNPEGIVIYRRLGDAEGQYEVHPNEEGVHELCFINPDSDGKLVTHVTNTLKSQHPVEREHVSVLAKYASHLDVRLGELESEQRLQQIRTDRFIKIEESTSQRVAFYGTLECFVYLLICLYQVLYIKGLLDGPRSAAGGRSWA